jgi:hypothetical protein
MIHKGPVLSALQSDLMGYVASFFLWLMESALLPSWGTLAL